MNVRTMFLLCSFLLFLGCASKAQEKIVVIGSDDTALHGDVLETFSSPWAMAFLPDGQGLVSEKTGSLWLIDKKGKKRFAIDNVPHTKARKQGGLGDIIVDPNFAENNTVYLSFVERDPNNDKLSGAVVESANLIVEGSSAKLTNRKRLWMQSPKTTGNGHYGHKLAISPDDYLFITSGDRQKFTPAQDMTSNLGKVLRINKDGSIPQDNPFYGLNEVTNQIWSLGHRNPLGIDFDAKGKLWVHEMGPRHGDELNLIEPGENYGYPHVSEGNHYSGKSIPEHSTRPEFKAPVAYWVPAISPAGFVIYKGTRYKDWLGDGFLGGLSSQALVRVSFFELDNGSQITAKETARYEWGRRVREIEQDADGHIYILEDGSNGRLLRLSL